MTLVLQDNYTDTSFEIQPGCIRQIKSLGQQSRHWSGDWFKLHEYFKFMLVFKVPIKQQTNFQIAAVFIPGPY